MIYKSNVIFILIFLLNLVHVSMALGEKTEIPTNPLFYDVPEVWNEMDHEQGVAALSLSVSSLEYALKSISTYSGNFTVEAKLLLDKNYVHSINKTGESYEGNMYRHLLFSVAVVSDRPNNKIYRNIKYLKRSTEYGNNIVDMDDAISVDVASVDTPKEHLFLESGDLQLSLKELPNHPALPINSVARITPPEDERNRAHEGFVDPYKPYDMMSWGSIDYMLNLLEGEEGPAKQNETRRAISIYDSSDEQGNKWFQYRQRFTNGNNLCIIWGEPTGFLPVYNTYLNPDDQLITAYYVKWCNNNDIYIPEKMLLESYLNNGDLYIRQQLIVDNCEINKPIPTEQFSLKALGLKEGGLVVNNIQKKIYKYENGKPVFFSKFNVERKEKEKLNISRYQIVVTVLGFAMIGTGIWLRYRKRKTR